jgi:hypothetical protein
MASEPLMGPTADGRAKCIHENIVTDHQIANPKEVGSALQERHQALIAVSWTTPE